MRERSFKLAKVNQMAACSDQLKPSPEVKSPMERIESAEMEWSATSTNTVAEPHEAEVNVLEEKPKVRKAVPVNKSGAPGPAVRPKAVPKLAGQTTDSATGMPTPPQRAVNPEPSAANGPLERKPLPFGDRYTRITSYLDKQTYRRIHRLHENGEIHKIASLLNAAVKEYLDRHYPLR